MGLPLGREAVWLFRSLCRSAQPCAHSAKRIGNSKKQNNKTNTMHIAITTAITITITLTPCTAGARLGAELRRRQHRRVLPPRAARVDYLPANGSHFH
jgi:hypothetical protein